MLMTTLADLHIGQKAHVLHFIESANAQSALTRRLTQLGFIAGIAVEILHESFPKRDPLAVRVGNHRIALRRQEAAIIEVECA